jgi:hypothetical protein
MPEDRPDKLKPSGWGGIRAWLRQSAQSAPPKRPRAGKVVTGGDRQPTALAVVRLTTIVEGTADQFCEWGTMPPPVVDPPKLDIKSKWCSRVPARSSETVPISRLAERL